MAHWYDISREVYVYDAAVHTAERATMRALSCIKTPPSPTVWQYVTRVGSHETRRLIYNAAVPTSGRRDRPTVERQTAAEIFARAPVYENCTITNILVILRM